MTLLSFLVLMTCIFTPFPLILQLDVYLFLQYFQRTRLGFIGFVLKCFGPERLLVLFKGHLRSPTCLQDKVALSHSLLPTQPAQSQWSKVATHLGEVRQNPICASVELIPGEGRAGSLGRKLSRRQKVYVSCKHGCSLLKISITSRQLHICKRVHVWSYVGPEHPLSVSLAEHPLMFWP